MRILCVGLMVCDISISPVTENALAVDATPANFIKVAVGGDAFNVASNLQALGASPTFVSAVGTDRFAPLMLEYAGQLGIASSYIQTLPGASSVTAILIHEDGERNFIVQRGASHFLTEENISDELLLAHDLLYIGSACDLPGLDGDGMRTLFRRAKAHGVKLAMDVTGNPSGALKERMKSVLSQLDLFLPSLHEAQSLSGYEEPQQIAAYFHKLGIPVLAIKMGKAGAYLSCREFEGRLPTYPGRVVDTTGAGDAFVSGFLAAYSRGMDFIHAAQFGNAAGTVCVGKIGSSGNLESLEQLLQVINSAPAERRS